MIKKYSIFLLAGILCLTSCLDREPLSGPSNSNFPANESEALAGIYACYKAVGLMSAQNNYFPYCNEDCATDIFASRPGNKNFIYQLTSSMTADQALIEKEYKYVFKVAGRCHQILDKLDLLAQTTSPEVVGQFKAEALCIRAHQYDQCMQFYGGITYITHCLTLEDNAYPRTPLNKCVDSLLFTDLTDANLDYLPLRWTKSTYGTTRIGRAAAYALKARIALNWGYLDVALDAAAKALACADEAGYKLEPLDTRGFVPHEEGELDNTALFGFAGEKSDEWLWAAQHSKLVNEGADLMEAIYYASPRVHGGCSWLGPSLALMDTYQTLNGLAITEDPTYDPKNPYLNRDPRMAITACLPGTRVMGIEYEVSPLCETVVNYHSTEADGSYSRIENLDGKPGANKVEYAAFYTKGPGGYLLRKFSDPLYYGLVTEVDDLNTGLLRYAEILLIDAEVNIESEKGDLARARRDINKLRARAGMPAVTATTKEGLRKALRYERKVELAGEGFRWFDLRRWALDGLMYKNGILREDATAVAVKALNGTQWAPGIPTTTKPTNYISGGKPTIDDNWIVTYSEGVAWPGMEFNLRGYNGTMVYNEPKDRRWPFPYTELQTNKALDPIKDQNPGY